MATGRRSAISVGWRTVYPVASQLILTMPFSYWEASPQGGWTPEGSARALSAFVGCKAGAVVGPAAEDHRTDNDKSGGEGQLFAGRERWRGCAFEGLLYDYRSTSLSRKCGAEGKSHRKQFHSFLPFGEFVAQPAMRKARRCNDETAEDGQMIHKNAHQGTF